MPLKQSEVDDSDKVKMALHLLPQPVGETILEGLVGTGFSITGTWPMRSGLKVAVLWLEAQTPSLPPSFSSAVPVRKDTPTISRGNWHLPEGMLPKAVTPTASKGISPRSTWL